MWICVASKRSIPFSTNSDPHFSGALERHKSHEEALSGVALLRASDVHDDDRDADRKNWRRCRIKAPRNLPRETQDFHFRSINQNVIDSVWRSLSHLSLRLSLLLSFSLSLSPAPLRTILSELLW